MMNSNIQFQEELLESNCEGISSTRMASTKKRKIPFQVWILATVVGSVCSLFFLSSSVISNISTKSFFQSSSSSTILRRRLMNENTQLEESLASSFPSSWCSAETNPEYGPLPYETCDASGIIYRIPLEGGMTNAIKMVVLGAIRALEEGNRCFFIDETYSHLNNFDKVNYYHNGFYARYFEKIGLYNEDPRVQLALKEGRIRSLTWVEVWKPLEYRRVFGGTTSIPSLGYHQVPNHMLKAILLKRLWRPLSSIRDTTCARVRETLTGSPSTSQISPFIAMSVRRGDKQTELFEFISMEKYLLAAEKIIHSQFQGIAPTIFVASDDCSVLPTLRSNRPHWNFVSECDTEKNNQHDPQQSSSTTTEGEQQQQQGVGFDLRNLKQWGPEEYDAHYGKFMAELYAMTMAKYWIGVTYTNVSWFVYFMRGADTTTFQVLDSSIGSESFIRSFW